MLVLNILAVVLLVLIVVLLLLFRPRSHTHLGSLDAKMDHLLKQLDLITSNLRIDFKDTRVEAATALAQNRVELNETLNSFRREMADTLAQIITQNKGGVEAVNATLTDKIEGLTARNEAGAKETAAALEKISNKVEEKLLTLNNTARDEAKSSRQTLENSFKGFNEIFSQKMRELNETHRQKFAALEEKQTQLVSKTEEKLYAMNEQAKRDNNLQRETTAASFKEFQQAFDKNVADFNNLQRDKFAGLEQKQQMLVESTEKRLDGIRETVEEKLQKTLQERLGQSFEMVSQQLTSVQKGLGEMQTLAQDVGGLKKVLSNVKMRGGFGEVQLHMLLENILAPEQYEANVATKNGNGERVEFAVKFPNKEGDRDYVWLPIDAKFPKDAYEHLQLAYDSADAAAIDSAQRALEGVIKRMARGICEKYIDAPNTTNFGIMFLPFEGLFAEVVRKASLLEEVQRDCNVVITGPTTLAVILNSLQMGFRTLAIQKRTSEVWGILGAVKKEFKTFGGLLEKAQKNIQTGLNQLDDVVGVRTRQINHKLRSVELLEDDTIADGETFTEALEDGQ